MAKKLSDFTVKVNLHGWYIKGYVTCTQGQEFEGDRIHPRMVQALEDGDDFVLNGAKTPVCILKGGSLAELKAVMEAGDEPASAPAPKPSAPTVEPPVEQDKPKPPVVEPPVEQDEPKPSRKPSRKPKPRPQD